MSSKYLGHLVFALGLAACASAATLGTGGGTCFNVSGTFADGATLSGTIDISTTAPSNCPGPSGPLGSIIAADLTVSTIGSDFTILVDQGQGTNGDYLGYFTNNNGAYLDLWIDASSLVNYLGGGLCDTTGNCGEDVSGYFTPEDPFLASGSLTVPGASAPEPATWMMLLAAPGLLLARRFRVPRIRSISRRVC